MIKVPFLKKCKFKLKNWNETLKAVLTWIDSNDSFLLYKFNIYIWNLNLPIKKLRYKLKRKSRNKNKKGYKIS